MEEDGNASEPASATAWPVVPTAETMKMMRNMLADIVKQGESGSYWLLELFINWTLSSPKRLRAAEKFMLTYVQTEYRGFFVDIGPVVGESDQIWTICLNAQSKRTPLVILHGLGAGLALWILNLDALAQDRPVYAFDLLGFGRSTRPQFSNKPLNCERQIVETVEQWRIEMKLGRFILLGHSMGGFVATSYAMTYPQHVQHLILADPWGFSERPQQLPRQVPLWVRVVGSISLWLNPYWLMRAAGPFGVYVMRASTADVSQAFTPLLGANTSILTQYMYQCNAATPSGEAAFHTLSEYFAFAKQPMIRRIAEMHKNIGITFIFGSHSWVDNQIGSHVSALRKDSFVDVKIIEDAGHHLHIDKPETFNRTVLEICRRHGMLECHDDANDTKRSRTDDSTWLNVKEKNLFMQ